MKYILCIDRGTTAIKAALYDLQANELAIATQPCQRVQMPHPGWCEQDMGLMWRHAAMAVRKVLGLGYAPEDICCVGVSGQGNGAFLTDAAGVPLRPGIVSLDSRSEAVAADLNAKGVLAGVPAIGSRSFGSASPLVIMRWLKENEPESYRRAKRLHFSKDWIRYCLTGEFCTDYTDPSGASLMDIATGSYSKQLCEACGVPEVFEILPPARRSYELAGRVTRDAAVQTGLLEGTPVVTGAHDIAACSLGSGGVHDGHLAIIYGTMGLNLAVEEEPYRRNGINFCNILPEKWISFTCLKSAGATLDRCVDALFTQEKQEAGDAFFAGADQRMLAMDPTDILFYPYLFGSNTEQAPCSILGMEAWHNKYHLLLAIYQGLVYEFAKMTEPLRRNKQVNEIWLIGGGSKSAVFPQLFADVLNQEIRVSSIKEATSRGVALCALRGLNHGEALPESLIRNVPIKKVFQPESDRAEWYGRHYALSCEVVKMLEPVRTRQKAL